MALDDYMDSEVAVAIAATTLVLSPRVRGAVRRGLVYGVAGVMRAADAAAAGAREITAAAQSQGGNGGGPETPPSSPRRRQAATAAAE